MGIEATMRYQEDSHNKQDEHENEVVMPGFRFHPTEEELVEFYLRRKVEGKRFNVELITSLDLYRYDPWELPALAAIGEKEWYFYVRRDRKYRNGDRPNRVTKSGYWKATGADRMIRSQNLKSIGLKKTLVFYSGKAPKGIRSTWIMNEYRLPQPHPQTQGQLNPYKAEISLCRVYKRAGVEDHPSLPLLPTIAASSSRKLQPAEKRGGGFIFSGGSPQQAAALSQINPLAPADHQMQTFSTSNAIDDLHKLVHNYSSQQSVHETHHPYNLVPNNLLSHLPHLQPDAGLQLPPPAFSDRLWDWNSMTEATKDYNNLFD